LHLQQMLPYVEALPKERKTSIQGFFRLKGISTL
jgi:hypothetical protein